MAFFVKRLHLLILRSYLGPFILTFFISLFLLLMQFLWKYIDELVGKGLDVWVIGELLLYASASLVPMALPLAILLSSIMSFGNMGEHYELIALKSAGISLLRIMRPLILLVFAISILAFFFSNNLMPYTNLKMGTLLFDVRHQRPEISIREGVFDNSIEGMSLKVGKKDPRTNMLYRIMIYDHSKNDGNLVVTVADSGHMKLVDKDRYLILTLFNGHSYAEVRDQGKRNNTRPARREKFDKQRVVLELTGYGFSRSDENLFKGNYKMLNLDQLEVAIDSIKKEAVVNQKRFGENLSRSYLFKKISHRTFVTDTSIVEFSGNAEDPFALYQSMDNDQKNKAFAMAKDFGRSSQSYISSTKSEVFGHRRMLGRHEIEWHRKFTLSFACFLLFFIGAPLGAIIRKGGLGMPVVVSVLFFVLYYVVSISGEKYVKSGVLEAWQGMWLSTVFLFPIGIILTYKATHDSGLFNLDNYTIFVKRMAEKIRLKFNAKISKDVKNS